MLAVFVLILVSIPLWSQILNEEQYIIWYMQAKYWKKQIRKSMCGLVVILKYLIINVLKN